MRTVAGASGRREAASATKATSAQEARRHASDPVELAWCQPALSFATPRHGGDQDRRLWQRKTADADIGCKRESPREGRHSGLEKGLGEKQRESLRHCGVREYGIP